MSGERNQQTSTSGAAPEVELQSAQLLEPRAETVATAVEQFKRMAEVVDSSPSVMIDDHCNIVWQSAEAGRLLQPPMPLWIKAGKLHSSGGSGVKSWPTFVEDLGEDGDRLLLTGKASGTWALVRGWAVRLHEHRFIFLKCALSWPLRDVTSSGLAHDFGLTRSESAVLDQFARLSKPDQIAETLSISVSTVRSHLKQIHTKMAVNSGVHLLRITRAYTDF